MLRLRKWAVRAAILAGIAALFAWALQSLPYRWNWDPVFQYRSALLDGLWMTLQLSAGALVCALGFGGIGCLLRISRFDALRFTGAVYVELIRNTPLLVQIFLVYYCIFDVLQFEDRRVIGALALGLFAGAYVAEILRAGVEAVDPGQREAALSLGLTPFQALVYIIGPQAFRTVIPPLAGQFVSLVKDSSLLMVIAIAELTYQAKTSAAQNYRFFEFYLAIAALYLAITFPLSRFSVWLEKRLGAGRSA